MGSSFSSPTALATSVIVLAGAGTGLVQRHLNWNEESKGAVILKRICGVPVLLAGLYLIYVT